MLTKLFEKQDKVKEAIIKAGGLNIKHYLLINNEGFTFELNGLKVDLRLWRNVYGCEANFYAYHLPNNNTPTEAERQTLNALRDEANKINNQ